MCDALIVNDLNKHLPVECIYSETGQAIQKADCGRLGGGLYPPLSMPSPSLLLLLLMLPGLEKEEGCIMEEER